MASIVQRPLNRLRKHNTHRPFHERWGDVSISAPTDGSWNQFDCPTRKPRYTPGSMPEHHRDTTTTTTETLPSKLNPRRLSMRLAPRPKHTQPVLEEREPRNARSEFAYKPIIQDYPSEVAEKRATATVSVKQREISPSPSPSPRFRYVPAPASQRYAGELSVPSSSAPSSRSQSRCSSYIDEDDYDDDERTRRYERGTTTTTTTTQTRPSRTGGAGYRGSYGEPDYQRASVVVGRSAGSSGRKNRSTRYMTMTMVPDPEDIYG